RGGGARGLACLFDSARRSGQAGSWARPSRSSRQARGPSLALLAPRSHRRRYTIPTAPPRTALQRSIGLFGGQDEDFCSRLEIGLVARHVGDKGRIGGEKNILFPPPFLLPPQPGGERRDRVL